MVCSTTVMRVATWFSNRSRNWFEGSQEIQNMLGCLYFTSPSPGPLLHCGPLKTSIPHHTQSAQRKQLKVDETFKIIWVHNKYNQFIHPSDHFLNVLLLTTCSG